MSSLRNMFILAHDAPRAATTEDYTRADGRGRHDETADTTEARNCEAG